jgi:hypothetical protein
MKKQKVKIPKSVRTYIRREKEKIRRSGAGLEEQKKLTDALYEGLGILKPVEPAKAT